MLHARPDYNRIQDPENKIPAYEPVFVLRAQDRTAAKVVRFWAHMNDQLPNGDKAAVQLALAHAKAMDAWPVKKTADVPPTDKA